MTLPESEQLAALWTDAQPVVAAFIRTLVRPHNEAEELLQRTAVVLVRKFHEYNNRKAFAGWAVGIARIEVLAYWRERASDRLVFDEALVGQIADGYQELVEVGPPARDLIVQCVAELEERAREAIRLRYMEEMKTPRIAESLGLSHGAARVLLTRARMAIRLCVEKHLKRVKA